MRFPKLPIPHGLHAFGVGTVTYGMFKAHQDNEALRSKNEELRNKVNAIENKVDTVENKVDSLSSKADNLSNKVDNLSSKVDKVIDSTKKLINISAYSIHDIFTNYFELFMNMDLLSQVYIFNIVITLFLSSLLSSYLLGIYGNYLIDRFDIVNRFPRLKRLIDLRIIYLNSTAELG